MRIKLLQGIVGDRFAYVKGDEVEWPDDQDAQRLIDAGYAVEAGQRAPVLRPPNPQPEAATKPQAQKAAKPAPRARKK